MFVRFVLLTAACLVATADAIAQEPCETCDEPSAEWSGQSLGDRSFLTGNWWGARTDLESRGIVVDADLTVVYQVNARGGISTHDRDEDWTGSYDIAIKADFEKLFGAPLGRFYACVKGGWKDGVGEYVGAAMGPNGDAPGTYGGDVRKIYYQADLLDKRLRIRFGKLNLTGGFDCHGSACSFDANAFANDERYQFLNNALVNNPSIPFPGYGFAAMLYAEPADRWYVSLGMVDSGTSGRLGLCTSFDTAFHGPHEYLHLLETGVVLDFPIPNGLMRGAYRVGLWYDTKRKPYLDESGRVKKGDVGFYLSFDQFVVKESDLAEDRQGLGTFFRYGLADNETSQIYAFWSVGLQYEGLLPTREHDVCGAALAWSRVSVDHATRRGSELLAEFYYRCVLTPWFEISPDLQIIHNPGGDHTLPTAVVLALRFQTWF